MNQQITHKINFHELLEYSDTQYRKIGNTYMAICLTKNLRKAQVNFIIKYSCKYLTSYDRNNPKGNQT